MFLNDSYMRIKCHVHFTTALRLHEIRVLIMGRINDETQARYSDKYLSIIVIFKLRVIS